MLPEHGKTLDRSRPEGAVGGHSQRRTAPTDTARSIIESKANNARELDRVREVFSVWDRAPPTNYPIPKSTSQRDWAEVIDGSKAGGISITVKWMVRVYVCARRGAESTLSGLARLARPALI